MTELCRHIGPQLDVPAGDIVGAREIGYYLVNTKELEMNLQEF
jgi:glutamate dehydrogenase (NADP+)